MQDMEEIVHLAQQGDTNAMESILNKHKNTVRFFARKYFLVGADIDDLAQEGTIGLYKAIMSYKPDANATFETYAKLCISRAIINAIKKGNSQSNNALNSSLSLGAQGEVDFSTNGNESEQDDSLFILADKHSPESLLLEKENAQDFDNLTKKCLSTFEQDVLNLYLDGNSYNEIAQILNNNVKSIDNALNRIKTKLKQAM